MVDKEKIRNFMQSCTDQQFKIASIYGSKNLDVSTTPVYDNDINQIYEIKRIILYKDINNWEWEVDDIFFLSDEDERKYIFGAHKLRYWRCTSEYGKYLFDKYRLNEQVEPISAVLCKHKLFKDNELITYYVEERPYVPDPIQWNIYKNMYIDLNPVVFVRLEETEEK